jgi:hypothetical protein
VRYTERNYLKLDLSKKIRERAYELWVERGYRDGEVEQNWLAAERELAASVGPAPPALPRRKKPRRNVASKRAPSCAGEP